MTLKPQLGTQSQMSVRSLPPGQGAQASNSPRRYGTPQPGPVTATLSGELEEAPPTGEARALIMAEYAEANGLELSESVVYADSTSDLAMLEAAGYPVAVNPETKLAAIARKRGWHVEHWPRAAGYRRPLLPFGPIVSRNGEPGGLSER